MRTHKGFRSLALALTAVLALGLSADLSVAGPGGPGGPGYYRHDGPRHHYHGGGYWLAPLAITAGAIIGTELYRNSRSPDVVVVQQPAAPAAAAVTWYWCASENAYYPAVRACPVGWTPVTGTSSTTPPAPPAP